MPKEIHLYDEISFWGHNPAWLREQLKEAEADDATAIVRINSPGGDAFMGIAMFNILRTWTGKVKVVVDGIAASAASVIAMGGDQVVMCEGAMMMIHNPSGMAWGESEDMRKLAVVLDAIRDSLVAAYQSKNPKLSRDEIVALLDKEKWMQAQEAVDLGFADQVDKARRAPETALNRHAARFQNKLPIASPVAPITAQQAPVIAPSAAPANPLPPARRNAGTPPGAKAMAAERAQRIRNLLTAISGALALALDAAQSDHERERDFGARLAESIPPIASEAQEILTELDPEGAKETQASLSDLLDVYATAQQVTGVKAGLKGALRALRDNAKAAASLDDQTVVNALVDQGIREGKIHAGDRSAMQAEYRAQPGELRSYLATARKLHAMPRAEIIEGKGVISGEPESQEKKTEEAETKAASDEAGAMFAHAGAR